MAITNNREIYDQRVKELIPVSARRAEDAGDSASQVLAREFKEQFGFDHLDAGELFQTGSILKVMLEHMYQDAMAGLLTCSAEAFAGIQAQAQLLNLFLHIPVEIAKINDTENMI